jgi:deazaflavin-dependent oxidoreductase (nitroreductase family)
MFGQLRLTSVGRKSGRSRHAVVDVLKHDAATDRYDVVSAYGDRSDWYRNLQANPTARVQVGRRKFSARATALPDAEAEALIVDFWRRHRLYVGTMFRLIGIKADTEDDMRAAAADMNVLALQPVVDD